MLVRVLKVVLWCDMMRGCHLIAVPSFLRCGWRKSCWWEPGVTHRVIISSIPAPSVFASAMAHDLSAPVPQELLQPVVCRYCGFVVRRGICGMYRHLVRSRGRRAFAEALLANPNPSWELPRWSAPVKRLGDGHPRLTRFPRELLWEYLRLEGWTSEHLNPWVSCVQHDVAESV